MNIEEKVKANLLVRGFDNKAQLNNRGLIGATIDETILEVVKNLRIADDSCGHTVLPTVLSLEEILRDAVRRQATYQVQFADYDLNTWTVPCILTQNRMDMLLTDASIRKVRLELEF